MAVSINDYSEVYKQAVTAYTQGDYEIAAALVDQVVQNLPDDPNSHLLRGHIYYVLQQYDIATAEYQQVLSLTENQEILDFAVHGLENINHYIQTSGNHVLALENEEQINSAKPSQDVINTVEFPDLAASEELDNNSFELNSFGSYQLSPEDLEEISLNRPFDIPSGIGLEQIPDTSAAFGDDPFALNQELYEQESNTNSWHEPAELELPAFWQEDISEESIEQPVANSYFPDIDGNSAKEPSAIDNNSKYSPLEEVDLSTNNNWEEVGEFFTERESQDLSIGNSDLINNSYGDSNFVLVDQELNNDLTKTNNLEDSIQDNLSASQPQNWLDQSRFADEVESTSILNEAASSFNGNFALEEKQVKLAAMAEPNNFDDDSFDIDAFESAFGSEELTSEDRNNILAGENAKSNIDFLDDFDEFDDLGNIPGFELGGDSSFDDVASLDNRSNAANKISDAFPSDGGSDREEELFPFTITGSQEVVPGFTQSDVSKTEPNVNGEQGLLAFLENAPLKQKPLFIAIGVGAVSAVVAAIVSSTATSFTPPEQRESVRNTGWAMALASGIAGGVTAGFMGNISLKQIRRTTKDLQAQFDSVSQGNLNVQATVYSEDELGHLATGFNDMARVIFTTTNDAQRKAVEQEEAKENLQRQVIRLLDDVEGAARGDLTVQAEVTADVLGAVADAFNLTIQNLRDIVQQVKVAAREVTKGSTNSETFARALSSDALRQAEELAVTLNSVQVMTDSIQRVAEAAREAEIVARDASAIALKGGEAVENTVAGILEIRETVAETTRKVKRLAESSQEISKIVALISQIASRTNLLALNASIEAARAGEAGRGFAIVADEVRQLADKSAKSLKEIEQIVMQIQSETGSVMTAMEEGTQQVIKGTKLAEEAKRSLENIIQVANRIDTLVRSITSDTVEQTETSRAVAQVMQSVELTAQENSQEAQRVSGALQHLVGVSRDLISSVERFRVETMESRQ
ncbi:methyl-accepting chemotaxis protein [Cylindrospermum sp. FACHB-282]|uniref:methyl-accepting chemotaxis protein n=1 Tax=Cylindrospermum sp. FACHB-282 TaxID=2692794 RepID=UPI001681DF9E|nr:methyl-accepting chemotaxis protein [Cylindrospermum sp. FACHB-282]MBD2385645.1 HAMP domain-containing protein [Cylindrospermum sp. FACHB-282]